MLPGNVYYHCGQGWGPLCQFLGVPEPESPFPHLNDTQEQQRRLRTAKRVAALLWAGLGAGLGAGLYWAKHYIPIPKIS